MILTSIIGERCESALILLSLEVVLDSQGLYHLTQE